MNKKIYALSTILFLLFFQSFSFASNFKGFVFDKSSKEQLVGATVILKPSGKKVFTSLDGSFTLKNLEVGTYNITISYIGFAKLETSITVHEVVSKPQIFYLEADGNQLSAVEVKSEKSGATDKFAQRREQLATSIINVVSANSIAISPDVTVANVMQRISGVSIDRNNSGEGQHVIIRGMDKKYNTTLINGVKIPSPDTKNRYVPLDIFPADLVDRIEVVKSLTPDMEGDASGGSVNLVMKNAPDHLKVDGNIGTGYSDIFTNHGYSKYSTASINKKSPAERLGSNTQFASPSDFPYQNLLISDLKRPINKNLSLTAGNRFLNKKLGVIVSGSFQNTYKGSIDNVLVQDQTVEDAPNANTLQIATAEEYYTRHYSAKSNRGGVESKLDYKFNDNNSISLFTTYLELNEDRTRLTYDTLVGGNVNKFGYASAKEVHFLTQTRTNIQSIFNTTFQGKHKLARALNADWSLVFSRAKNQMPDIAEFSNGNTINNSDVPYNLAPTVVDAEKRQWLRNTDKDYAGYVNFVYKRQILGKTATFGFGGMYRHKERDNYSNSYSLSASKAYYTTIQDATFNFIPSTDARGDAASNAGVFHANENVSAGYIQGKYDFLRKLEIIAGVRFENTYQYYLSSLPVTIAGKSATITYIDPLPSLQGKYTIDDKRAIRFSYFRSLFRPSFTDLIPYADKVANDSYLSQGNPNIQHTVIDNFDVRYEMFPKGLDQFMIGAFYKIITNPIEYGFVSTGATAGDIAIQPTNYGTAHNAGFELVFRKYFGSFGISGNYTFTNSVINATKSFSYKKPANVGGDTTIPNYPVQRQLSGQSKHIGNFSLLYKDEKRKIDAQLALVYTGERINTLTLYRDIDDWERATTNLDFSIQKGFSKHYVVFAKANNLLNTPFHLFIKEPNVYYAGVNPYYKLPYQKSANYLTIEYNKFYASYSFGFKFKF